MRTGIANNDIAPGIKKGCIVNIVTEFPSGNLIVQSGDYQSYAGDFEVSISEKKEKVPNPKGFSTHKIPHKNWPTELANAVKKAMPGDVIECHTEAMAELGENARARLCSWKPISFKVSCKWAIEYLNKKQRTNK